jgi:hypothetical protein
MTQLSHQRRTRILPPKPMPKEEEAQRQQLRTEV